MKNLLIILVCLGLVGCATMQTAGMINVQCPPSTHFEKDPDVNFNKYKTFSVFPQADLDKELKMSPIIEKQLLFIARNRFELLGYEYIDNPDDADMLVSIFYSNEYKSEYIPPSSYTVPWYVPGQTQTTFLNSYNNFSGSINRIGGGTSYFSGSGSGWGTATTQTPGYYVPLTMTRPGGYVGWYYPFLSVSILDRESKKIVWSGSSIVTTSEPDIRLSAQVLSRDLIFGKGNPNFPLQENAKQQDDQGNGAFGLKSDSTTTDGNSFYPVVFRIFVDSPAYKQGIKLGDTITHIDRQSVLNLSDSDFLKLIDKNKGETVVFTIKRNNKTFDITLTAEDEEVAKREWTLGLVIGEKGETKKIFIPK